VDLPTIAFIIVSVLVVGIILYSSFTRRGQKELAEIATGGENATLIGELSETEYRPKALLFNVKQKTKVFRCEGKEGPYYTLESIQSTPVSVSSQFVKLTPEMAESLKNLLS
jgi:hypothetical protein